MVHFFLSRSFDSIWTSKTPSPPSRSKSCQLSQRNHGERASTLPRTKPQTRSSQSLSAKPSTSIFPSPKPNSSLTLPTVKPKPSDSLHLPASQASDLSPLLHQPAPKPSVSPTLTVPTPRLSPSPMSLCQGTSSDGPPVKQPSPIAKERRAKSIPICNVKAEKSNEIKHEILDQDALLDFTHPEMRKGRMNRESQHQTYSESYRRPVTSSNPCFLQSKLGLSKKDNTAKDEAKALQRSTDITALPKPKWNINQHQEFQPSRMTGTQISTNSKGIKSANVDHQESPSVFDGPATLSGPQRKYKNYPQKSNYSQTLHFTSAYPPYEQLYSEKKAALPVTSQTSFSTEPLFNQSGVSPSIEARRRRFDLHSETRPEAAFLSASRPRKQQEENNNQTITGNSHKIFHETGASQNIKSPQRPLRFPSKAQSQTVDVRCAVSQSHCLSKDYSCQSREADQKMEASQCTHRLNQLKTCQVAPQTQEASHPPSGVCTTSQRGSFLKPDLQSHRCGLDQEQSPPDKQMKVSSTGLNQTDMLAPPDLRGVPAKLPEHPSEKYVASWPPSVAHCPFSTDSFGLSSKGVFDRVYQSLEKTTTATTASSLLNQLNDSETGKVFFSEESEDPYYVTMYYPGSIYVGEYKYIQVTCKILTEQTQRQRLFDAPAFIWSGS